MTAALVDLFCRSFPAPPATITLDIDNTCHNEARNRMPDSVGGLVRAESPWPK